MLSDSEYELFVDTAVSMLVDLNDSLEQEFHLSQSSRWDLDYDAGQLVFSNGVVPNVVARIQYVGSVSLYSNTWLWSWDNGSIARQNSCLMLKVREFGEANGIAKLTAPKFPADEEEGWRMTAIAASVLDSRGGFLGPLDGLYIYLVMQEVMWASEAASILNKAKGRGHTDRHGELGMNV